MYVTKRKINIQFRNGLSFDGDLPDILGALDAGYEFVNSSEPEFVIFGPYGNDLPEPGNYTRVGYYCENIFPALDRCEKAFGVPREEEVNNPNYQRIQWHGINPLSLVKTIDENEIDRLVSRKKFCNFLYSNRVPYRERFFKKLSRYKRIDAPGKSMNNTPFLGDPGKQSRWEQKRAFLASYKFTIAFENDCYPGYQTEKLYDPMQAMSVPVYCGDPCVGELFNTGSFLNHTAPAALFKNAAFRRLAAFSQQNFEDILPQFYLTPGHRARRKLKAVGRNYKMSRIISSKDTDDLIERIVCADRDPDLYAALLRTPWLKGNSTAGLPSPEKQWERIFNNP